MIYTPNDIEALLNKVQEAKHLTSTVLTVTRKQEVESHRDLCADLKLQLSGLENYYDDLIEEKRRDMADTRQAKKAIELLKKEIAESGRRCNGYFFELLRDEPR